MSCFSYVATKKNSKINLSKCQIYVYSQIVSVDIVRNNLFFCRIVGEVLFPQLLGEG